MKLQVSGKKKHNIKSRRVSSALPKIYDGGYVLKLVIAESLFIFAKRLGTKSSQMQSSIDALTIHRYNRCKLGACTSGVVYILGLKIPDSGLFLIYC